MRQTSTFQQQMMQPQVKDMPLPYAPQTMLYPNMMPPSMLPSGFGHLYDNQVPVSWPRGSQQSAATMSNAPGYPQIMVNQGVTTVELSDAPTLGPSTHAAYQCGYCGVTKLSASAGGDGRVRIRCSCGGRRYDGVPRMHAMWRAVKSNIIIEPKAQPDNQC
jgi:hypothetical protein